MALDWDGTLCGGFTVLEWAACLHAQGAFPTRALDDMRRAIERYHRSEVDYARIADVVPRFYAAGLAGLSVTEAGAHADSFVASADFRARWSDLVPVLDGFLRNHPHLDPVLVSGAPHEVLARVAASLGDAAVHAIRAHTADGRYTGGLVDNPAEAHRKAQLVAALTATAPIVLAAGDTAADIPMLEVAERRLVVGPALAGRWSGPEVVEVAGRSLDAAERAVVGALLARLAHDVTGPPAPA